jgi:hypothetical protein
MAVTEPYTGTNATWGTEYSLTNGSTTIAAKTDAIAMQVFLDVNALAKSDKYILRLYEKCRSGDTQRQLTQWSIFGDQAEEIFVTPMMMMKNGWDVTLTRSAGTDQTITWSVRSAGATVTEAYTNTNGTWGTEYSLTNGSTTIAAKTNASLIQVVLDVNALAQNDKYIYRIYEKARTSDTQRVIWREQMFNAQPDPLKALPPLALKDGWDVTLQRTAGTDRTILSSVRAV